MQHILRASDESKLIRDGCNALHDIDCYRDPSVLQFVAISASDAFNNLKKGNLAGAAKNIFDRRNVTSLKAVWGRSEVGLGACERQFREHPTSNGQRPSRLIQFG